MACLWNPLFLWVCTYIDNMGLTPVGMQTYREFGLVENATALLLFVAIIFFLLCLKKAKPFWVRLRIVILAVGSIYFLGEEISWGYHFFSP